MGSLSYDDSATGGDLAHGQGRSVLPYQKPTLARPGERSTLAKRQAAEVLSSRELMKRQGGVDRDGKTSGRPGDHLRRFQNRHRGTGASESDADRPIRWRGAGQARGASTLGGSRSSSD
jgi:hypothetical protein